MSKPKKKAKELCVCGHLHCNAFCCDGICMNIKCRCAKFVGRTT